MFRIVIIGLGVISFLLILTVMFSAMSISGKESKHEEENKGE